MRVLTRLSDAAWRSKPFASPIWTILKRRMRWPVSGARLRPHPNIVGIFDYGETPEVAYIVMEFVDGTSLKQVLGRNERFPLAEIVRIMRGLLAGLQYSHERSVVHRDIKPANMMLTPSGEIKIADFGIAQIESSSLTQAGTMLGTPSYMSPEQFTGQTVDFRTDIYSAGVVLYQLLTGEKPFDGGFTAIMHKVIHTEPPLPSALAVSIPPAFDKVVQKAMAKQPSARFASAAEFAAALQGAFEQQAEMRIDPPAALADADATQVATRSGAPAANPARIPANATAPAPASPPAAKASLKLTVAGSAAALVLLAFLIFVLANHKPAMQAASVPAAASPLPPPAPAHPPAPAPAPAPTPVPARTPLAMPPSMSAVQRDAALQSIFGTLPCSLIGAADAGGKVRITGIAGAGVPQAAFTAALNALPASIAPQSTVQPFDGPYCAVLDTIRPYNVFLSKSGAELGLGLANGISILQEGQFITVKEKMPGYAGYLQTDYFLTDGSVWHLYPTATDPLTKLPAESRKVLGNPKRGRGSWRVAAPFGTNMIISIVTPVPLFPNPRPQEESASDYLPALGQALQNVASAHPNLDVAAVLVITEPKQ
jgi:serine/threonine-protein kinase